MLTKPRVLPIVAVITLCAAIFPSTATAEMMMAPDEVSNVVKNAASAIYGSGGVVTRASNPYFAAAFPYHELYVVTRAEAFPPELHSMAWNPTLQLGFDITSSFNGLMADAGAVPADSADAIKYSKAYAETANVNLQARRNVALASDSSVLGVSISNPTATLTLDGWQVALTTWAPENGVLADWTIQFRTASVASAKWRVNSIGVGPSVLDLTEVNFIPGHWIWNVYPATGGHQLSAYREASGGSLVALTLPVQTAALPVTPTTTGTNFDGSTWIVAYPSQSIASIPAGAVAVATASRDAAVRAYNMQIARSTAPCGGTENPAPNWGFVSKDPNCLLDITVLDQDGLLCGACVRMFPSGQVVILIAPTFFEITQANGFYTNASKHTLASVMRPVIAHEYFHHVQHSVVGHAVWTKWGANRWRALQEGQARFIETLSDPDVLQDASSIWYASDIGQGVNAYPIDTGRSLCGQEYGAALFWGWFYDTQGGLSAIRTLLEKAAIVSTTDCVDGLSTTINLALGGTASAGDLARQSYRAFSLNYFAPRDYMWTSWDGSVENWGLYLNAPPEGPNAVGSGGFSHKPLPATGTWDISCSWSDDAYIYKRTGAVVTSESVACGSAPIRINSALYDEVAFAAVRTVSDPLALSLGFSRASV